MEKTFKKKSQRLNRRCDPHGPKRRADFQEETNREKPLGKRNLQQSPNFAPKTVSWARRGSELDATRPSELVTEARTLTGASRQTLDQSGEGLTTLKAPLSDEEEDAGGARRFLIIEC